MFKKKRKKPDLENRMIKPQRKALIVKEQKNAISVFFHDQLILKHSVHKPFATAECRQNVKYGRKTQCVRKRTPLTMAEIDKDKNIITFYKEPISIKTELKEKDCFLYMDIINNTNQAVKINVPRGTKEKGQKKEQKTYQKELFTTKRPNLMLNEKLMLSIETLYEWDIYRTNKEAEIELGKKATLLFIKCYDKDDGVKKYIAEKNVIMPKFDKKEGVYLTVSRKNYIKKVEKLREAHLPVQGIILDDIEIRQEIDRAISYAKKNKLEVYIKMKPYIPINRKYQEQKKELMLKDHEGRLYIQEINQKKYYAVDFSKKAAVKWQRNLIREMLDKGVKGIIAEKAVFDKEKVNITSHADFDYSEVWHIIWQKLIKEAVDEYPNRTLLIRNNGIRSVRYGVLMTDEKNWRDIDRIKKDIDKTKLLGTDTVITEIGGVLNKGEKRYKKLRKWKEIANIMPMVIFGNIPEKIIERIYAE